MSKSVIQELVENGVGISVSLFVLLILISVAPCYGGAAVVWALSVLGPFGLIGGIASLGIITLLSKVISSYGLNKVIKSLGNKIDLAEVRTYIEKLKINNNIKQKMLDELDRIGEVNG